MRTQSSQMEKDRKQMAVGQMGTCYLGIVSVLKYEKFQGWTGVVAAQRQEFIHSGPLDCTLKNGYGGTFHVVCVVPQLDYTYIVNKSQKSSFQLNSNTHTKDPAPTYAT